jgi:hypothetical protein
MKQLSSQELGTSGRPVTRKLGFPARFGSAETHYQDRRRHSGACIRVQYDIVLLLVGLAILSGYLTGAGSMALLAAFGALLALLDPGVWSQPTSLAQAAPLYSLTAEVKRRQIFRNPARCRESEDTGKLRVAEAKLASS